jgi:hypothetical protein
LDRFVIDLPALRQNGELLGNPDRLAVRLSPGTLHVHGEVAVQDDQLNGHVTLFQDQLQLQPMMANKYSKYLSTENLQAIVSSIQQLRAELVLTGSLTKPETRLESNLGPELAAGLNRAVRQQLLAHQEQLMQKANAEVTSQLDKLQQELVAEHGKILETLEIGDEQLDEFRRHLTANVGSPSDLIRRGQQLLFK